MVFDSDSYLLALDNCASKCMSFDENDFVPGTLIDVMEDVQGIGRITAHKQGTLKWSFEDDDGVVDTFLIPESYLACKRAPGPIAFTPTLVTD